MYSRISKIMRTYMLGIGVVLFDELINILIDPLRLVQVFLLSKFSFMGVHITVSSTT